MMIRDGRIAKAVVIAFLCMTAALAFYYFWMLFSLNADGLSRFSRKLPYWDFSNLWAGGRFALDGNVSLLFDPEAYRAALRAMFNPKLPDQEWSYPPSFLLIGAPLAMLPILPAYLIWTLGTTAALYAAILPLKLPPLARAAILLSPAMMMNALLGQNGALTTALLVAGLWHAPKRPWLAGLLFGLLSMKPHLGMLVPVCLLASGNWRAIFASAISTAAVVVMTGLIFGWQTWAGFIDVTGPLMTAIMEAPYLQPYQTNALTIFIAARWLGFGLGVAYSFQILFSLLAAFAAGWLWRPGNCPDLGYRISVTLLLVLVATPYGYSYDAIMTAVASVWLILREKRIPIAFHGLVWWLPQWVASLHLTGFGAPVLIPVVYAAWALVLLYRDKAERNAGSADQSLRSATFSMK